MRRSLAIALALIAPAAAQAADPPSPVAYDAAPVTEEVHIPMDDGVELAADIGFPAKDGVKQDGPFPVILTMTPYGKDALDAPWAYFVSRGYIHAVVDIRGAGASGGTLNDNYFSPREQKDGGNLIQWLGTQPWSTGNVGMSGGSYLGITQYLAAAQKNPHLKAIIPAVALADLYRDATYHGGALSQFFGAQYIGVQGGPGFASGPADASNPDKALAAKLGQATSDPIAFDYLTHTTDDSFYKDRSPMAKVDDIDVPTLILDGWFDGFMRGASEMWRPLSARRNAETQMIIDPNTHKGAQLPFDPMGYPDDAYDSPMPRMLEFLDRHLKGMDTPQRKRVKLFLMGRDSYIEDDQWPPKDVKYRRLGLKPGGFDPQPAAGSGQFVTNPLDGWTNTLSRHGTVAGSPHLPLDQSLEKNGGLVWETDAVDKPLAVVGPMALDIAATSTAPDTDWSVRVSDVAPDGSAKLLTEGYLRASHRELDKKQSRPWRPYHPHTNPTPIEPNKEYRYAIEVWPTAMEFQPGHRMRVQLVSNDAPNHSPGTFTIVDKDNPDLAKVEIRPHQPALNTIRYGGDSGSSLVVPVLGPGLESYPEVKESAAPVQPPADPPPNPAPAAGGTDAPAGDQSSPAAVADPVVRTAPKAKAKAKKKLKRKKKSKRRPKAKRRVKRKR